MPERVERAAITCGGEVFSGKPEDSHGTIVRRAAVVGADVLSGYICGFLTSTGRFVNRYEALSIAREAGQLIHPDRPGSAELFTGDWR